MLVGLYRRLRGDNKTMKRIGNLYHLIYDIENIKLAHKNARKGKTHYSEVKKVDADIDYYCQQISDMLKNKTFVNSQYEIFTKNDKGKEREIYKLPYFPDRIVHHAILQVLEPIWKKTFITTSYQSIKGRGVHRAKKDVEKAVRNAEKPMHYLQMDIKKFYPSVDNTIMERIVARKIKCKGTLWLLSVIIRSMKGLPIGNYISQYLGNLYLTYLDHYVKEVLGVKWYFRYCDDIVLLGYDKEVLARYKDIIIGILKEHLKLEVKPTTRLDKIGSGLDFLGFVFKGSHTVLRKSIAMNFKIAAKKFVKNKTVASFNSVISYNGWMVIADTYNLWSSVVDAEFIETAKQSGLTNKVLWR